MVTRKFTESKEIVYNKCLSSISQCNYTVDSSNAEAGIIYCIAYNLQKEPCFKFKCTISSQGNSSVCTISTDEVLQGLPILDKLIPISRLYINRIIKKM